MGLFDLPAPVFNMVDGVLALGLPHLVRLVLWTVCAVGLGFLLYKRLSFHASNESGDAPKIHILPMIYGVLPTLFLGVWFSNSYEYAVPKVGTNVKMELHSIVSQKTGEIKSPPMPKLDKFEKAWPIASGKLVFRDTGSATGTALRASPAVPVVAKKVWWNALFGNPIGYIPAEFAIEKITFGVSPLKLIPVDNYWLSNWKTWFALVLGLSIFGFRWLFNRA